MYLYISFESKLRRRLRDTMTRLLKDIPNIRIALIAHSDYDCQNVYVLKTIDFTNDVSKLVSFAMNTPGTGGRGPPEVYTFLYICVTVQLLYIRTDKMSWNARTKTYNRNKQ